MSLFWGIFFRTRYFSNVNRILLSTEVYFFRVGIGFPRRHCGYGDVRLGYLDNNEASPKSFSPVIVFR